MGQNDNVSNEAFYRGCLFLEKLLSSYGDECGARFMDNIERIDEYVSKSGLFGLVDSEGKEMCLEAIARQYDTFVELSEKLKHGSELCKVFADAIDRGSLELFNAGKLLVADNDDDCESLQFGGAVPCFVEREIERYGDEEDVAEVSGLEISVDAFIDFLVNEWDYPFCNIEGVLSFECVRHALKNELAEFVESEYPNVKVVD